MSEAASDLLSQIEKILRFIAPGFVAVGLLYVYAPSNLLSDYSVMFDSWWILVQDFKNKFEIADIPR